MVLAALFILSFIVGFIVVWWATPSSNDKVVYIEDVEEFLQACYEGMRRGIR